MKLIKYIILLPIEFIRSFLELFLDKKLFKYSLVPFLLGFLTFVLISSIGLFNVKLINNLIFNEISSWYQYSYYSLSFILIIFSSSILSFLVILISSELYIVRTISHLFNKYELEDQNNNKVSIINLLKIHFLRALFLILSFAALLVISFFPPLLILWYLLNSFIIGCDLFSVPLEELNFDLSKKSKFYLKNKFIITISGALFFLSLFVPMINLIAIQVRMIYSTRVIKKYILVK